MAPRGIRNNNPGNVEKVGGVIWEGQSASQSDPRFVRFDNPVYGIRALVRVLITYADARFAADGSRINTVQDIIDRWAPPVENNTVAYVRSVSQRLNVEPDEILSIKEFSVMKILVESIIYHENGSQPYSDTQIIKGMALAGIEPAFKPLNKSRTVTGGKIAGAAGTASTVAGAATAVAPALPVFEWLQDNLSVAMMVLGVAGLVGVGYMIWARYDDREKGLR